MEFPLTPINNRQALTPGKCVLVRRPEIPAPPNLGLLPCINHYWIAVIFPDNDTPEVFQEKKTKIKNANIRKDLYAVWIVGTTTDYRWLSPDRIFELCHAHLDAYRLYDGKSDFITHFSLAEKFNAVLEPWRYPVTENQSILDKRQQDRRVSLLAIVGTKLQRTEFRRQLANRKSVVVVDGIEGEGKKKRGKRENRHRADDRVPEIDQDGGDEEDDSHLEESDYERPVRKKVAIWHPDADQQRICDRKSAAVTVCDSQLRVPSPPFFMTTMSSTFAAAAAAPSSQQPLIKREECDDDYDQVEYPRPTNHEKAEETDMIDIYVGPTNTRFSCSESNVAKSSALRQCITHRDSNNKNKNSVSARDQPRTFIMDPSFSTIQPTDFTALMEFLATGEYDPILIGHPPPPLPSSSLSSDPADPAPAPPDLPLHGSNDIGGTTMTTATTFTLDTSTSPITPSSHLLRSARLYNLAKRFQVPAFAELIFCKILFGRCCPEGRASRSRQSRRRYGDDDDDDYEVGGWRTSSPKYEVDAFLDFAGTVLGWDGEDFRDEKVNSTDGVDEVLEMAGCGGGGAGPDIEAGDGGDGVDDNHTADDNHPPDDNHTTDDNYTAADKNPTLNDSLAGDENHAASRSNIKGALEIWTIKFLAENMALLSSSIGPTSTITTTSKSHSDNRNRASTAVPGAAFWSVMSLQRHDVERRVLRARLESLELCGGGGGDSDGEDDDGRGVSGNSVG